MKGKSKEYKVKTLRLFVCLFFVVSLILTVGSSAAQAVVSQTKESVGYCQEDSQNPNQPKEMVSASVTLYNRDKITGFIKPDVVSSDSGIKAGFKVEVVGTELSAISDSTGFFEVSSGLEENCSLKISKAGYLTMQVNNICKGAQIGKGDQPAQLWPGDVEQDGAVNMCDIVKIIEYYNTTAGDAKYYSIVDFNKDKAINMEDILISIQHFNKSGTDYPLPLVLEGVNNTPTPTSTGTPTYTPTPTTNGEPAVRYIGRFDFSDPAGPKFAWTGSAIIAQFKGTSVSAKLKRVNPYQSENWLQVKIDDGTTSKIQINKDGTYQLASGLANGVHRVELMKRTEALAGEVQFLGFEFDNEGQLLALPVPAARRIEFIGDSITAGYGNEAPSQGAPFKLEEENGYMTYAAIAARALGAEQVSVCWSGKGVYRDCGTGVAPEIPQIPQLYSRILPDHVNSVWDFSWKPDVVVINLGTNDFSFLHSNLPDKTLFVNAYKEFLETVRNKNTNATIYLTIGPLLSGERLSLIKQYLGEIINERKTAGDQKMSFLEFPAVNPEGAWHPSIRQQQDMAALLVNKIRTDLGW
ncbi:MAG: GDSL-type esterase/lipase family protein [Clostridia bacterium]|nr:GDSL-type esterase/lipase family protein [Clostridia bacterium]